MLHIALEKNGQQQSQCRFKYPRPIQHYSDISFEKISDGTIHATVSSKCNDTRVNSHSRLLLQNWRANVDLQVTVDVTACARYMSKYVSESEPRTRPASDISESCIRGMHETSTTRSAFCTAMICAVGERDISSQETAHLLLSLPLFTCTFNFVTISLTRDRQILQDAESNILVLNYLIFNYYSVRTTNIDLSLLEFASQYYVFKGELRHLLLFAHFLIIHLTLKVPTIIFTANFNLSNTIHGIILLLILGGR